MRLLAAPPTWLRWSAAAACALLAANLFWHGAKPYAVGLIPSPWDKLAHAAVFGALSGLAWLALGARRRGAWAGATIIGVALAIADEARQAYLPGRQADLVDFAADVGGIGLALLACKRLAALGRGTCMRSRTSAPEDIP